jgi:hypothetical protein
MRFKAAFLLLSMVLTSRSYGQSAQVTNNALMRTFMIETNFGRGTTFSIDVDNREYWLTAKHMFTGIETGPAGAFTTKTVHANILSQVGDGDEGHDLHWFPVSFTTIDPGKDIDILVLVPDHALLTTIPFNLASENANVPMGGDCEFIGFPYGGGWKVNMAFDEKQPGKTTALWFPYVKHCTVSAQLHEQGLYVWILDGINNHGFSGGPVLIGTGANQKVFAVISGYHQEPLEVLQAPSSGAETSFVPPPPALPGHDATEPQKQIVNANSGFIIAFSLDPVIKAIRANPIGPLLPAPTTSPTPSTTPAQPSPQH